jgi:hypothetical protein
MRQIRLLGACVAAVAAVSMLATAAASAALPELGRCEKVGTGGAYKYKNCIIPSSEGKGAFEWSPGPGAKPKVTAETGTVFLETVGHAKVTCTFGTVSGEWTGPKTANVNLSFSACQNSAKKTCQTSPTTGASIQTEQPATTLLTFTCGGPPEAALPETWTVEGSVIGPVKGNGMILNRKLFYKATGGKQNPEQFEGGPKDTLLTNRITGLEPPKSEQAGLTINGPEKPYITAEGEEPLEIKAT